MSSRTAHENRHVLLEAISARLENMGVPAICTLPSGKKIRRTFGDLCAQILDQCDRAVELGIDFRAGFEVNEVAISQHAERLAQQWYDSDCQMSKSDLPWVDRRPSRGNRIPKRWFKQVLLRRERQICDYFFKVLGETGKYETPIICDAVLQSKERQNHHAKKFAAEHELTAEINGEAFAIPFSEAASTAQKRSAKLYVRALGLEKFCTKLGLKGFFVTLTLRGKFHSNPATGRNTWNGSTPEQGHEELQRLWRLIQREVNRVFGKMMGIRVEEPHDDGTPHFHLLVYIKPEHEAHFRRIIERYFGNGIAAKVEAIDPAKGRGASYIMKYILPVLNASDDTIAARYQAFRATWGKRAIQIFDCPGSSTIWDQMRRIKPESDEYQTLSSYAHELHGAACNNDYCEFLCILNRNVQLQIETLPDGSTANKKTRRVSILYWERLVVDCSAAKKKTTSKLKKIQGIKDHENPIDTHPHDWKIERKAISEPASRNRTDETSNDPITTAQGLATVMHSYPSTARPARRAQNIQPEKPNFDSMSMRSGTSMSLQTPRIVRWCFAPHPPSTLKEIQNE